MIVAVEVAFAGRFNFDHVRPKSARIAQAAGANTIVPTSTTRRLASGGAIAVVIGWVTAQACGGDCDSSGVR